MLFSAVGRHFWPSCFVLMSIPDASACGSNRSPGSESVSGPREWRGRPARLHPASTGTSRATNPEFLPPAAQWVRVPPVHMLAAVRGSTDTTVSVPPFAPMGYGIAQVAGDLRAAKPKP